MREDSGAVARDWLHVPDSGASRGALTLTWVSPRLPSALVPSVRVSVPVKVDEVAEKPQVGQLPRSCSRLTWATLSFQGLVPISQRATPAAS